MGSPYPNFATAERDAARLPAPGAPGPACYDPALMRVVAAALILVASASLAEAADPPLVRARAAYNAADFEAAIALAEEAIQQKADADQAALVGVRARLERYRLAADEADLAAAHSALRAISRQRLRPREQAELLVAQGLAMYLGRAFGAAGEMFDSALAQGNLLGPGGRDRLLEWWALALDREAQTLPADRRPPVYARIARRMEQEVRDRPSSVPGNYWLAAAARGEGEPDRAWDVTLAAWVRVPLDVPGAEALRQDLDQLVAEGIIPERSRLHPRPEWSEAASALEARWAQFKKDWE